MRLTATDKAIGELSMRKSDIVRAKAFIEKYDGGDVGTVLEGINGELALMDRCADMLRSVAPAPKPEKSPKVGKPRKARGKSASEVDA